MGFGKNEDGTYQNPILELLSTAYYQICDVLEYAFYWWPQMKYFKLMRAYYDLSHADALRLYAALLTGGAILATGLVLWLNGR